MGATPYKTTAMPRTPPLLPAQGGQSDGPMKGDPPAPRGPPAVPPERTAHRPPPPAAPTGAGSSGRAGPPQGGHTTPSQAGGERDRAAPPQSKPNGARDRGRTSGGAQTVWNGPTGARQRDRARCARHTDPGRGGGRERRESASAHTRKGHAGNTRRATGPRPRNAQTAWNGVPASKDKGQPDGTARHTQRGKRGAGRGKRGRHKTQHRPRPPRSGCERCANTTRALHPPMQ